MIRRLIAAALLACACSPALAAFVEGTITGVPLYGPWAGGSFIFLNTATGTGPVWKQWHTYDVTTRGVPVDAKAVYISGILIITHGAATQICDLSVTFQAPGAGYNGPSDYILQTTEANIGGGQRQTFGVWVPVVNGQFQMWWNRSTYGAWPAECSYGLNVALQAYVR